MKQFLRPISIIVPTLNEADNLALLFERIHTTLAGVDIPYEIIVVDDHSTDGTADIVRHADPKYQARVLIKQGKRGKAFSLLEGFAAAEHELVCMIDADLQYPPEAIKLMYHKMQYMEADIILSERIDNKTSKLRRLSSYVFNLLFTRLLFGIKYDTQSGLKLFRKDVLKHITLSPSAWTFDLEFIVRALEQNYVVASQQIPFSERHAGVPKVKLFSATVEIASGSFKLWRTTSTKRVKLRYKHLEALQNRALLAFGVLLSATLFMTMQPSKASALSLPAVTPVLNSVTNQLEQAVNSLNGVSKQQPTAMASRQAPANPTTTSDASSSKPQTTTTNQASSASQSTTQPKNGSMTVSTANGTTLSQTPASSSNPSTLTVQTGKNAVYYPTSKLSSNKTSELLKVALSVVEAGGLFIAIGLLIVTAKALAMRIHRQPLRN